MQYRKKPVIIEAFQWTGKYENLPDWFTKAEKDGTVNITYSDPLSVCIATLEGNMFVAKDDYIIKGIQGELYPCKPQIFEATYEKL